MVRLKDLNLARFTASIKLPLHGGGNTHIVSRLPQHPYNSVHFHLACEQSADGKRGCFYRPSLKLERQSAVTEDASDDNADHPKSDTSSRQSREGSQAPTEPREPPEPKSPDEKTKETSF